MIYNLMISVEDDSPYPEVRSAVANTDDPSIPCNSFRAWVMGTLDFFSWLKEMLDVDGHDRQASHGPL
jgi:hypothetical protein